MSTPSDGPVADELTEHFEVLFPGRSPVAETHAGAILALLRSAPPEEVAQALGWEQVGIVTPGGTFGVALARRGDRPVFAPPLEKKKKEESGQ